MPYKKESLLFRGQKCLSVCLAVLCLGSAAAQAKSGMPRGERHESRHEIDQLEETWKDAILKHNVQVMDGLLADDYISITSNGTLQSKEQTLGDLKAGTLHFSSIDFSDRKVRFYGQTALVTSRAEVNGNTGEGDISGSYRFTRVYVRDGKGDWKIVSFEASRIRESGDHK
jgi:ketosteroid isomerase-like protein